MAFNLPTADAVHALEGIEGHLAFDDFGAPYSSVNFLRVYPIDTRKVDQSFVRDHRADEAYDVAADVSYTRKSRHVFSRVVETREPSEFLDHLGHYESQSVLLARSACGRSGRGVVSRHLPTAARSS